jgi:hypothetical protein
LKEIDDDIEEKRRKRLQELEDIEKLLADFKKMSQNLDDALDEE